MSTGKFGRRVEDVEVGGVRGSVKDEAGVLSREIHALSRRLRRSDRAGLVINVLEIVRVDRRVHDQVRVRSRNTDCDAMDLRRNGWVNRQQVQGVVALH